MLLERFTFNICSIPEYSSFESICIEIPHSSFSAHFICLYRPPGEPAKIFEEFQELLENLVTLRSEINVSDDFNLHLDTSSAVTTTFGDILTAFDLKQHVTFATHIHGHWLDLVIPRSTCDTIQAFKVVDGLADHHTVIVYVKIFRTTIL